MVENEKMFYLIQLATFIYIYWEQKYFILYVICMLRSLFHVHYMTLLCNPYGFDRHEASPDQSISPYSQVFLLCFSCHPTGVCPAEDEWYCGSQWPERYCTEFEGIDLYCPYMCGVCPDGIGKIANATKYIEYYVLA